MKYLNEVSLLVFGNYALFTDPVTRIGGERLSYNVPTYQSLKGILESVYWKPSIKYIIDEVRVMNSIQMESKGILPMNYHDSSKSDLSYHTYLKNPAYQVRAHFVFNEHRTDLQQDWNEDKHYQILKRSIKAGGRRDIFLGTRECQAYVEPCVFGEGEGAYDQHGMIQFGMMVHGFNYPDEIGRDELEIRLWSPKMENGYIKFIKPEECDIVKQIKQMKPKEFRYDAIQSVDALFDEL